MGDTAICQSEATLMHRIAPIANFKPLTYRYLIRASCAVSQHLATICTFLAVFVKLREGHLDARILVWISVGGFLVGYLVWEFLSSYGRDKDTRRSTLRTHLRARLYYSRFLHL